MSRMRAKFKIDDVKDFTKTSGKITSQNLVMSAVIPNKFGEDGENEDNDFARWTPSGELTILINNPDLIGAFKRDDKIYLDFTKAEQLPIFDLHRMNFLNWDCRRIDPFGFLILFTFGILFKT